jgi:hypothetical protein
MKYLSTTDLRDGGYLQEVNRRFFHPLGLALEATLGPKALITSGDLCVFTVQDHRADPEGVIFGDVDPAHVVRIDAEWKQREPVRETALGWMIEPAPIAWTITERAPETDTLRAFHGIGGSAHELMIPPPREGFPEQVATLAHWFVRSPMSHPLWPHYLFCCVHLRDVDGQTKPPHRRCPDASHELMLMALNPELGPWSAGTVVEKMLTPRTSSAFLTPLNVSQQIRGAADAQAVELTALLARGMVDGIVPIEPQDYPNGRERWAAVIANTLEHIRTGGHPSDN